MLIDATEIVQRNKRTLESSAWAMENVALANAAIDVLRSICELSLISANQITVLRLGIRLINAAGSAGDALLSGYYQPAAAQIRDLIEVGFLIDLFRRDPARIETWRTSDHATRRRKFSAFELRKELNRLDGSAEDKRAQAYQFFTSHGTHADPDSIDLNSPNRNTMVGPFPDRDRLVGLGFELARYLAAGTEYFVQWILQQETGTGEPVTAVAKRIRLFREACQAIVDRKTDPRT